MERLTEEKQLGLFASLKDKSESVPGAFANYDCLYAHMIAVTRLKQYEDTGLMPEEIMALLQPPNTPLTLEELREMDGEPVWVDSPSIPNGGYYLILNKSKNTFEKLTSQKIFHHENYGNTWLAYRRRPEEGTE